ncbi:hypothetical protein RSAG8_13293, partial [Rhizoctonia solani AG-8 WAC10335]
MAHSSSMGKYGILHIVNRKNNSPAYSYPVDSEQTTFGRNDDCDIRLLYGWVSGLHCKLFFQNGKVRVILNCELGSCSLIRPTPSGISHCLWPQWRHCRRVSYLCVVTSLR